MPTVNWTWDGVPPPRPGMEYPPCWLDGVPPPKCEQTDTCENSTFPHTLYVGGNYQIILEKCHISKFLSLICGPGLYEAQVSTTNSACWTPSKQDDCVVCPGDKIKSVAGDDLALCLDVCDGITNVANVERTACGKFM